MDIRSAQQRCSWRGVARKAHQVIRNPSLASAAPLCRIRGVKQIVYVSPVEQVRCVLSVTAAFWQVKPRPVRAPLADAGKRRRPPAKWDRPPDSDRLEQALAQGWRWAV